VALKYRNPRKNAFLIPEQAPYDVAGTARAEVTGVLVEDEITFLRSIA
jgi:hypothetical protein